MLVAITSALVLQNTIYSNFFIKFFDKIVKYDTSHYGSNGKILDINLNKVKGDAYVLKEKTDLNVIDMDCKNVIIGKIGSARKLF